MMKWSRYFAAIGFSLLFYYFLVADPLHEVGSIWEMIPGLLVATIVLCGSYQSLIQNYGRERRNAKWQMNWIMGIITAAGGFSLFFFHDINELPTWKQLFEVIAFLFGVLILIAPLAISHAKASRDPATLSDEEHQAQFLAEKQDREEKRREHYREWLQDLKKWFYDSNKTMDATLLHSISQMNTFWNYHEKQFIEGILDHNQFGYALQYFLFPETIPQPPPPPAQAAPPPEPEPPKPDPNQRPWYKPRRDEDDDGGRIEV